MLLVWGGTPTCVRGYQASPGPRKLPFVDASCMLYSHLHVTCFFLPLNLSRATGSFSPFLWLCDSCPSQGIRSSGAVLSHHPKTKITISLCLLNCKGECITSFQHLTLLSLCSFPPVTCALSPTRLKSFGCISLICTDILRNVHIDIARPLLLPFLRCHVWFWKDLVSEEVKSDPQRLALNDTNTHLLTP